MPTLKTLAPHLRPREKLVDKGVANLKDHELLAILLRTGRVGESAIEIAQRILKEFPIKKLLNLTLKDLTKLKGIGNDKASTILAAFELTKRGLDNLDNSLPIIDSPQKVVDQLTQYRNKKKEHFIALYLNARNQLVYKEVISVGTLNASLVHPREVFTPALKHHAVNIILVHNHPSGDLTPSSEDKNITNRLEDAGKLLGIEILDHLIITPNDFLSFREEELK